MSLTSWLQSLTFNWIVHVFQVDTEIARSFQDFSLMKNGFRVMNVFGMLQTPEKGARTTINCAVNPELAGVSGVYYINCKPAQPSQLARQVILVHVATPFFLYYWLEYGMYSDITTLEYGKSAMPCCIGVQIELKNKRLAHLSKTHLYCFNSWFFTQLANLSWQRNLLQRVHNCGLWLVDLDPFCSFHVSTFVCHCWLS